MRKALMLIAVLTLPLLAACGKKEGSVELQAPVKTATGTLLPPAPRLPQSGAAVALPAVVMPAALPPPPPASAAAEAAALALAAQAAAAARSAVQERK